MEQGFFCNPVPFSDQKRHTAPDPFVLRWCGMYYCYATDENGVKVSTSPDLVHWEEQGYALQEKGHRAFWAPAVLYQNGVFYLYYSREPKEQMQLATSADPLGPFMRQEQLFELFSIDAHPVRWNGASYLFYASDEWMGCDDARPGTSILVDRLDERGRPEGAPRPVVLPDSDTEIFEADRFGDGRSWHTLEGACLLPGPERSFLLYSANCYETENYYVHYAVAENRPDLREMVWRKQMDETLPFPLLHRSRAVAGTGHNTVVLAPDLVHWWMVYHGRPAEEPILRGTEQRLMYIAPLTVGEDALWLPAPDTAPQPMPRQPQYHCAMHRLAAQQRWEVCPLPAEGKLESWFCPQQKHTGVKFSLFLKQDEENGLALEFHTGRRQITLREKHGNVQSTIAELLLPQGFAPYVPHLLSLQWKFGSGQLWLDETLLLSFLYRTTPRQLAVAGHHSETVFAGLSVAHCFTLRRQELCNLGRCLEVSPAVLDAHGLHAAEGRLTLGLRPCTDSEEEFVLSGGGRAAVLRDAQSLLLETRREFGLLRRVCKGEQRYYYWNGELLEAGIAENEAICLHGPALVQYRYASWDTKEEEGHASI